MTPDTAHAHLTAARHLIAGVLQGIPDHLGDDLSTVLPALDGEIRDLDQLLQHQRNTDLCERLGAGFAYEP